MRRTRRLTLTALADKTGLTKSYLSQIERGLKMPSIASTLKIARAFGVQVGQLFGEVIDDDAICVVRSTERKPFVRPGAGKALACEAIAHPRRFKRMEPFIMRPPRQLTGDTLVEHEGEELIYVLKGRIEVIFADRRVVLGAGDSLYFDGHLLHRSRSLTRPPAEALVVISGG